MVSLNLRRMTPDDTLILAAWMVNVPLWRRYGLTVERARTQFDNALRHGDILQVADTADKHACGFAWCMIGGAFGRSVYLQLIGVQPDLAGQGIGAALLNNVEQVAAAVSNDLFLLVSDFNLDAQRFYHRQGYSHVGSIPAYVLPDVDELIYWKRLR
ncbi:MAG TPA: N-acetyltransferase [Phototrophicaceae bacterium]|nr:N-acetyltransferase [Phototrophicaceae bacterium]